MRSRARSSRGRGGDPRGRQQRGHAHAGDADHFGRAALVRGDATRALGIALAISADSGSDQDLKLSALDLAGRAHDFLGDRDAARAMWERQAREALAAGRTQAQLRAVVQLGKIELFAGQPPQRLFEAVELAREAGALVELGWAQENLAIALGIQGDFPAAAALLEEAVATCRALRLDQLAYLLIGQAATSSYSTNEGVEERLAEAEALLDTSDLRLHTSSIRADIAFGPVATTTRWHGSTSHARSSSRCPVLCPPMRCAGECGRSRRWADLPRRASPWTRRGRCPTSSVGMAAAS